MSATDKPPLVIAGLSIYRDARPCLRSCLDSFVYWVDGVMVLHGPGSDDAPGKEFSIEPQDDYDETMQVVQQCASRFDPQNVKVAYYREHPQRFVLLEMMQYFDEARTIPVTKSQRMQTLLAKTQPGNYLFYIKPNEVLVGDLPAALKQVKASGASGFTVEVADGTSSKSASWFSVMEELRIVKVGPSLEFDAEGEHLKGGVDDGGLLPNIRLYRMPSP